MSEKWVIDRQYLDQLLLNSEMSKEEIHMDLAGRQCMDNNGMVEIKEEKENVEM